MLMKLIKVLIFSYQNESSTSSAAVKIFTREALGRPWSLLSGLGVGSSVGCVVSFFFPNGQKRLKSSKSLGLKIATLQKLAVLPVLPPPPSLAFHPLYINVVLFVGVFRCEGGV